AAPFLENVAPQIQLHDVPTIWRLWLCSSVHVAAIDDIEMAVRAQSNRPRSSKLRVFPLIEKRPVQPKDLNAGISPVRHVDAPFVIERNAMWRVKLARLATKMTPVKEELSIGCKFRYTTVDIAIGHIKR